MHLDGDVAILALELMHAQTAASAARKLADSLDVERREVAARLGEWDLVPGMEYVGNGVKVKRTKVDDSERLSLKKLRDAGAVTSALDATLRPFITASGGHDRWTIKPAADSGTTAEDFGADTPF